MTTKGEAILQIADYAEEKFGNRIFMRGIDYIPASGAVIDPEDVMATAEVALSGWYTEHKACAAFGRGLKKVMDKSYATLCNSGSSANLLAISSALEYFDRKKFIVTCATGFPTSVSPIYQNGQIPIYVDIDPITMAPSVDEIAKAMEVYGRDISGFVLAHTLGFPYDEPKLMDITQDKWLVADCCDALGSKIFREFVSAPVGVFAEIATLSFFPAHQITTGEGGAVLTNIPELHHVIESYSNWGRDCYCAPGQNNTCGNRFGHEFEDLPVGWDHKYTFTRLGYNLKMTEFQGGLGLSQLSRLGVFTKTRKYNFAYLDSGLHKYEEFLRFVKIPEYADPSPFGFPITVRQEAPFITYELISYLESHKIGTRRVFGGNLTCQPAFKNLPHLKMSDLRGSNEVMNNTFWIGVHPALTKDHLDYVLEIFENFFKSKGLCT